MADVDLTYQPLHYVALGEQTYRLLKDKILRRELKPGSHISMPDVAVALGVSRTPVAEALKRLASEGLVEIAPRRGAFVTELTVRDVAEIFDMRLMIELHAAETVLVAGKAEQFFAGVSGAMAAMERAIASDDDREYEAFFINDSNFHTTLVKLTGNSRLIRTYTELNVHTLGARIHYLDHDNVRRAQNEHRAIVTAFENGSVEKVKAALRTHIINVKERSCSGPGILDNHLSGYDDVTGRGHSHESAPQLHATVQDPRRARDPDEAQKHGPSLSGLRPQRAGSHALEGIDAPIVKTPK